MPARPRKPRAPYNPRSVARYAPAALVAALLVATGVAFLHTESLKLETSPIRQTRVTKLFSPVCRCDTSKARIAFRLAKPDVVSVSIVDSVRAATCGSSPSSGRRSGRVAFLWNGRDDAGTVVARRLLPCACAPRPRREDVRPAEPDPGRHEAAGRRRWSPSGRASSRPTATAAPTASPCATRSTSGRSGMLYVDGVRRVVGASLKPDRASCAGTARSAARSLPAAALRPRGRRPSTRPATGRVPVNGGPGADPLRRARARRVYARRRAASSASACSPTRGACRWRLGKRSGVGRAPVFRIRAPQQPGRYLLVVSAHGHEAAAAVVVAAP